MPWIFPRVSVIPEEYRQEQKKEEEEKEEKGLRVIIALEKLDDPPRCRTKGSWAREESRRGGRRKTSEKKSGKKEEQEDTSWHREGREKKKGEGATR